MKRKKFFTRRAVSERPFPASTIISACVFRADCNSQQGLCSVPCRSISKDSSEKCECPSGYLEAAYSVPDNPDCIPSGNNNLLIPPSFVSSPITNSCVCLQTK